MQKYSSLFPFCGFFIPRDILIFLFLTRERGKRVRKAGRKGASSYRAWPGSGTRSFHSRSVGRQLAASGAEPQSLDIPGNNPVPQRRGRVLTDNVSPIPDNLFIHFLLSLFERGFFFGYSDALRCIVFNNRLVVFINSNFKFEYFYIFS